MQRHGRGALRHVDLVGERVAVDPIPALEATDVEPGGCPADRELLATQPELVVVEPAVRDLGHPERMGQHELHLARRRAWAHEPALEMQRLTVGAPALLEVRKPRVADVVEGQGFGVVEGLDRRVAPGALAPPGAEQQRERNHVAMQLRRHAATVPRTRGTTCGYGVPGSSVGGASSSGVSRSSTTCWSSPTSVLMGDAGGAFCASSATCS